MMIGGNTVKGRAMNVPPSEPVYRYVEPDEDDQPLIITVTRSMILKEYFPYWSKKLTDMGREHLITEDNCVDDFIAVHWAQQIN